jgi:hypothetical protein
MSHPFATSVTCMSHPLATSVQKGKDMHVSPACNVGVLGHNRRPTHSESNWFVKCAGSVPDPVSRPYHDTVTVTYPVPPPPFTLSLPDI